MEDDDEEGEKEAKYVAPVVPPTTKVHRAARPGDRDALQLRDDALVVRAVSVAHHLQAGIVRGGRDHKERNYRSNGFDSLEEALVPVTY